MGRLSGTYLIGLKWTQPVEVDPSASNQHEFNGVSALRRVLGEERIEGLPTRWFLLRDQQDVFEEEHLITWYDARENVEHRSAEWRLYYRDQTRIVPGDLLVVMRRQGGEEIAFLSAPAGSSWESQLCGLLGTPADSSGTFVVREMSEVPDPFIQVAESLFEAIGWLETPVEAEPSEVDRLVERFGASFPPSRAFSAFARERAGLDARDPDAMVYGWWKTEEVLFMTFEKLIVAKRLEHPFNDVDDFITFSMSVHQRRRSRAGMALENHLEALLKLRGVKYSRTPATEGSRRPDFIFPGAAQYHDSSFDPALLSMLGVKTTCKERWSQILTEADRIWPKHLCTLEPAVSRQQLTDMKDKRVVLVAPRPLLTTYDPPPGMTPMSISEFVELVADRERRWMH